VLQSLERSARLDPAAVAVVDSRGQLSYGNLIEWIAAVTRLLGEAGVGLGDTVALTGPRCSAVVAAMWAVVAAGAAYLPLDSGYPRNRLAHRLADSGAKLLLHVGPEPAMTAPRTARIPEWAEIDQADRPGLRFAACDPDATVRLIYTSGSTGQPKGVALPHRCIDSMANWQRGHGYRLDLRTAQFAPLNFDVWFQEVLGTRGGGGTLVIMPEELRQDPFELLDWLVSERIERLLLPFVALNMLATAATEYDPPAASDCARSTRAGGPGRQSACGPGSRGCPWPRSATPARRHHRLHM
jgi:non-ribosomal peptide synthetase component F